MPFILISILVTVAVFSGMLALIEAGWRLGRRKVGTALKDEEPSLGVMEAFVFGLLGLLIAFSFTGAMTRFDTRKALIVEEANAISTAYLRLDLLPPSAQPPLRSEFREYTDIRLNFFRHLDDEKLSQAETLRFRQLQDEIWSQAVAAAQSQPNVAASVLLLPSLNEMFDITSTRALAIKIHPPMASFVLLLSLILASSFLAGYAMRDNKKRSWPHILTFVLMAGATLYLIIDVEYPRVGLIRLNDADFTLEDVRAGMH